MKHTNTEKSELYELGYQFSNTTTIDPSYLPSLPALPMWVFPVCLVTGMIILGILASVQTGTQIAGTALAMCAGCQ
jgi:hypothetical protein